MQFIFDFLKKNPLAIAVALLGGLGIVNVLDSVIMNLKGIEWILVPDWLRPIFEIIRDLWYPVVEWVLGFLPFEISEPVKNYLLMGVIVAGMRFRSSMVIWNSLKDGALKAYTQPTILPDRPIILHRGELKKLIFLFLPVRLTFAFIAWPVKLTGALYRWGSGKGKKDIKKKERKAREEQYFTFFTSLMWAVFILFLCLVFR